MANAHPAGIWADPELRASRSLAVAGNVCGPWFNLPEDPPDTPTVLVIGRQDTNLAALRALLEGDGYRVIVERRFREAIETIRRSQVDMVIIDSELPDDVGLQLCRSIRMDQRTELLPVLMLSGAYSPEREIACMGCGADGFLSRPFYPGLFSAWVRSMLRRKTVVDRMEESEAILMSLAQAVEHRDNITAGHCDRLAALGVAMGMAMGLPAHQLLTLHRGGYLHDVGKIGIPDAILFKKGPLDHEEWRIMRTHTIKGEDICRPMRSLRQVLPIIRSHHERWDGSGYPDALEGHNIPLLARITQVVDIYDALTSARSYKPAMISTDALRIMQEETDRGWHDPELMQLFLRFRHEDIREATMAYGEKWQDVELMKESLANLHASLLRY